MRIRNEMDPFGHSVRGGGYDNPCVESPDVLYGPTAIDSDALPWSLLNIGSLYFNRDGKEWSYKVGDTEWRALASHAYDVRAWGAKGDGTTDDSTAIQAACDAAATAGCTVHFPHGTFLCATGITIGSHCTADPCATISYSGTGTAVTLYAAAAVSYKSIELPNISITVEDHTGSSIGVNVKNVNTCRIVVPKISDFARGLVLTGDGGTANCNYNTFHIGTLFDNKINLDLSPADAYSVNQNTFIGGRCYHASAHGSEVSGYYQARLANGSPYDPNDNTFIGLSFEGNVPEYHLVIYGNRNMFINCRWETTGGVYPKVYWGAGAFANQILYGYGAATIVQTYETGGVTNGQNTIMTDAWSQHDGNGDPLLRLMPRTSDANAAIGVYNNTAGGFTALSAANIESAWKLKITANALYGKETTDADDSPRTTLNFETGAFECTDFKCTGTYLKPLQLGAYYLWVDTAGKLRIHNADPTAHNDGTVVGAQTA